MNNIDKELIAMCDCPEIQDKWRYEKGSQYYFQDTGIIIVDSNHFRDTVAMYPDDKRVYIPRIEDVWGWYGANMYVFLTETLHPTYFEKPIELLKGLLKRHMHLNHNKSWDGEKWV